MALLQPPSGEDQALTIRCGSFRVHRRQQPQQQRNSCQRQHRAPDLFHCLCLVFFFLRPSLISTQKRSLAVCHEKAASKIPLTGKRTDLSCCALLCCASIGLFRMAVMHLSGIFYAFLGRFPALRAPLPAPRQAAHAAPFCIEYHILYFNTASALCTSLISQKPEKKGEKPPALL